LHIGKLGVSLGGLDLPLISINDTNHRKNINTETDQSSTNPQKKCVIVCGRVHPGESNGSYMIEGFL
jgi:hypothetical protein